MQHLLNLHHFPPLVGTVTLFLCPAMAVKNPTALPFQVNTRNAPFAEVP